MILCATPTQGAARFARGLKHRALRTHAMTMTAFLTCFLSLCVGFERVNVGISVIADTRLCGYATIICARDSFTWLITVDIQLCQKCFWIVGRR